MHFFDMFRTTFETDFQRRKQVLWLLNCCRKILFKFILTIGYFLSQTNFYVGFMLL